MKIKDMANEIREQMPKDLDELETLRKIYICLGKKKNFDCRYYFGNRKVRHKIYHLAELRLNDENFLVETKNLICTSIASTLKMLGKEFDIDIELEREGTENGTHMYNIAKLKDGRMLKLDLQQDLRFIHSNRRTRNFGVVDYKYASCVYINNKELEQIDEKIGYKNINYKDDDIAMLKQQTEKMNAEEATEFILNSDKFNEILKQEEGYTELFDYVMTSLYECVDKLNIGVINCYRDKNINNEPLDERQYSMCICTKQDDKFNIYMFKKKERKFIHITAEQMRKLVNQGLKFQEESYWTKRIMRSINSENNKLKER